MSVSEKQFINEDLLAPNVVEIDVDPTDIAELAPIASYLQRSGTRDGLVDIGGGIRLFATHPGWKSDIVWISQADRAGYDYFENIFRRLHIADNVARYIAHDRAIVMYSGFFVTRRTCTEPNFHFDWVDCGNDAFTYLGPVSANCSELGLVYRDLRGGIGQYTYRPDKGLVFGDYFLHSTAPGRASGTTVLLSFTFGTDRMENWEKIARTAASQGMFHRRPDGQFMTSGGKPSGY